MSAMKHQTCLTAVGHYVELDIMANNGSTDVDSCDQLADIEKFIQTGLVE
jgi:hypothetical protein